MTERGVRLERVLLPVTLADSLRPALSFAARCARALSLPLETLFIEDEELLAFASLPFARATEIPTQRTPAIDVASVLRRLELEARRARRILEAEAGALTVVARFATIRAEMQQALTGAARASDLLVLGGELMPPWDRRIARELISGDGAGGLLLLEPRARPCLSVTVLYAGVAEELDLAVRLAAGFESALNVIVVAQARISEGLQARAAEKLGRVAARFSSCAPERLGQLIETPSAGDLLIAPVAWGRSLLEELTMTGRSPRRSILLLRP